jgi:hypothetical protein
MSESSSVNAALTSYRLEIRDKTTGKTIKVIKWTPETGERLLPGDFVRCTGAEEEEEPNSAAE